MNHRFWHKSAHHHRFFYGFERQWHHCFQRYLGGDEKNIPLKNGWPVHPIKADALKPVIEASKMLSRPEYVGADYEVIANSMTGTFEYEKGDKRDVPDFNVFSAILPPILIILMRFGI